MDNELVQYNKHVTFLSQNVAHESLIVPFWHRHSMAI